MSSHLAFFASLFQRTEKGKEYDLFVLKIQKLEKLCRALQDERVVLYDKIKEVRHANANLPSKVFSSSNPDDIPDTEGADKCPLLTPTELQEIQEEDSVLTEDMSRLKQEQAKLQEFAASLLATPSDDDDEEDNHDIDPKEDVVASAFVQFQTKPQVKEEAVSVPEVVEVKSEAAASVLPEAPTPAESTSEMTPADAKPEAATVQPQVEDKEVQPVKPDEEIQQQPAEPEPTPEPEQVRTDPPTDPKPEAAEAEIVVQPVEVKPVIPVEEEVATAEPVQVPEAAATTSVSAPPSENAADMTASSSSDSSKKQTPKKKKKRNGKSAS